MSLEPDSHENAYRKQILTSQIIAFALLMGILTFAGVAWFMVTTNKVHNPIPPLLYLSWGSFVLMFLASLTVPAMIARSHVEQIGRGAWTLNNPAMSIPETDTGRLLVVFQLQMIIGRAMLEGAAFLGLITYLVTGEPLALIGPGAVVVLMILSFPTRGKVMGWVEMQMGRLDTQREDDELQET